MAVVRYDNHCATIPFVGEEAAAIRLHDRMTQQTHKHHVYLFKTDKTHVPLGPYSSLKEARQVLGLEEK